MTQVAVQANRSRSGLHFSKLFASPIQLCRSFKSALPTSSATRGSFQCHVTTMMQGSPSTTSFPHAISGIGSVETNIRFHLAGWITSWATTVATPYSVCPLRFKMALPTITRNLRVHPKSVRVMCPWAKPGKPVNGIIMPMAAFLDQTWNYPLYRHHLHMYYRRWALPSWYWSRVHLVSVPGAKIKCSERVEVSRAIQNASARIADDNHIGISGAMVHLQMIEEWRHSP